MTNVPIHNLPVAVALNGGEYIEIDTLLPSPPYAAGQWISQRVQTSKVAGTLIGEIPAAIEYVIDGGGFTISAGVKGYLIVPFNGVITEAFMLADVTGSIIVNIWKCTYGLFDGGITHPVASDSITSGAPPTLSSQVSSANPNLFGWNTGVSMGDVLAFQVPTASASITRVTLSLQISRNIP